MKKLTSTSLRFITAALGLACCLLTFNAQAQSQYFGVTAGIANGGTYSWDAANWSVSAGTSSGPFTFNWTPGDFARFYGGASDNYTVTVNASEQNTGMYLNAAGATLNINDAGSGLGSLNVITAIQGFLVASGENLYINVPITGAGGVAPESSGSLYLYGNNTYIGGTALGDSGSTLTYINNNNSFGAASGAISLNRGAGVFSVVLATAPVTIANNWTDLGTGDGVNFASSASCPVVCSGTWSVGASGFLVRNNGASTSPLTLSGKISGSGGVTFSGANTGTIIVSGANAYTGATTVGSTGDTAITLKLGAANTIASSSSVIMAGGTLDPDGFHHAMASTTLGLTVNSTIDYTSGAAELDFAKSSALTWAGTLNLKSTGGGNWNTSGDNLVIGTDATGLTVPQLGEIEFNGTDLGDAGITSQGYIIDTAQVPEPSTLVLSLLGGLGLMWNLRRRAV